MHTINHLEVTMNWKDDFDIFKGLCRTAHFQTFEKLCEFNSFVIM